MNILERDILTEAQKIRVMELWNSEYPTQLQNEGLAGFDVYLDSLQSLHHLLAFADDGTLMGWAFSFIREGERWFAIIIDSNAQRQGVGSALLEKLKERETALNGWVTDHDTYIKQNGEQYYSPMNFYLKNGFRVLPDTRLEIEKLSAVKIVWTKEN